MKLRNKLIPLISLTATAAAVAPLASCGNVSLTETEMTDVLHGYLPDIARADASGTLTEAQAKDLYVDHVKKNTDIFAQDLYWWESMAVKYRLYNAAVGTGSASFLNELESLYGLYPTTLEKADSFDVVPSVAKFSVTDVSIQDNNLVNPNTLETELVYSVSMKFNYEYKFEINADVCNATSRYQAQRTVDVSLTSEYKNVPFTVIWDTEYACWRVMVTGWYKIFGGAYSLDSSWITQTMENWSFNFDYKSTTTDVIKNYEGGTDTYIYDGSKGGLIDSYAKLKNWLPTGTEDLESTVRGIVFNFGSYHMYDVIGPKWSYGNIGFMKYANAAYDSGNVFTLAMQEAITRNWTYAEYKQKLHPSTRYGEWTLPSVIKPGETENAKFDLVYLPNTTEARTIGTVSFTSKLTYERHHHDESQNYVNIGLNAEVTINESETEILAELKANPYLLLRKDYCTFTIPNQTAFTIKVCFGEDEEGEKIYNEETFKVDSDITCFWTSDL